MIIAVDFDGTCVTHDFPLVGKDIGAVPVLKKLVEKGHKLILWTMRSGGRTTEDVLKPAVQWFKDNEIPLYRINENSTQKSWTQSPKVYAELYIDDTALGCPLIVNPDISKRPFVDWVRVESLLKMRSII